MLMLATLHHTHTHTRPTQQDKYKARSGTQQCKTILFVSVAISVDVICIYFFFRAVINSELQKKKNHSFVFVLRDQTDKFEVNRTATLMSSSVEKKHSYLLFKACFIHALNLILSLYTYLITSVFTLHLSVVPYHIMRVQK